MASGIEMMLKSAGIDVEKITADFTTLKDGVIDTLKSVDAKLQRIEERQQEILWQIQKAQSQPLIVQQPPNQPLVSLQANPLQPQNPLQPPNSI